MTQIRQMTTDELFIATIICGHLSYLCHLCAIPLTSIIFSIPLSLLLTNNPYLCKT